MSTGRFVTSSSTLEYKLSRSPSTTAEGSGAYKFLATIERQPILESFRDTKSFDVERNTSDNGTPSSVRRPDATDTNESRSAKGIFSGFSSTTTIESNESVKDAQVANR